ncbi:hypothetical protein [Eubacterium sp. 1001713B170207_170306_E7]|uniref:hypothetical protein n=1 Tax=Eubacterium sp. 1001713B170207_170306_E7 TaxID=2787097 RepID=UPI00189928A8|nr:hypothetical protein [Eubacterium sp. 1001713B170207_170306_E7]
MNRYGVGRPVVDMSRPYYARADCRAGLTLWAGSPEAADTLFQEFAAQVEDRFPEIVLELRELREEETLF